MRKFMIAAAALAAAATPALAQTNTGSGNGLVAVNIQNVDILKNFLNDTQIAALNNVPITVQAPISVAANVCGTTVNALAAMRKTGAASCDAKTANSALANIVQRQKLRKQ
jgi:protein-arginine kinase activator protein McsA